MKRKIFMLLVAAVPFVAFCQTKIGYRYDNAGNRIQREIILITKASLDETSPKCYSEMLSDKDIRIYPNPTEGHLKVEISNWEDCDQGTLQVYNTAGQMLLTTSIRSSFTELDLSSQAQGLYILHILVNIHSTSWKVIKK